MRATAAQAFKTLGIRPGDRAMLSLDGGGIRGIMTIQLLKELERVTGTPCHQIFDLVAGTSTGGIIAGLVATGHSAVEIEKLYQTFLTKVFVKRSLFSNRYADPAHWSKASYRAILKSTLGDVTLAQAGTASGMDILITSHDVAEGEETFFSYIGGRPDNAYGNILLRAALEATMSAPTYFTPFERFVDGGTTTFNNPALAAVLEGVQFGNKTYNAKALTVYSFGTGCRSELIAPEAVPDPPGPDAMFWLNWLMNETGNDASDMQSDLLRAPLVNGGIDYRRFQLSLDRAALAKLPVVSLGHVDATDANSTRELTDAELATIELDNVGYFPVMQAIGQAFVQFLNKNAADTGRTLFGYDLIDANGKELLVTRSGNVAAIAKNMSDPAWVDSQPV